MEPLPLKIYKFGLAIVFLAQTITTRGNQIMGVAVALWQKYTLDLEP